MSRVDEWRSVPLKYVAGINERSVPETTDPTFEFDYIDIGSVGHGRLVEEPETMTFENAPSRARRVIRCGDTIVSTVRTYLRAVLPIDASVDAANTIVSTGFAVVSPRGPLDGRYFGWVAQSDPFIEEVVARSEGVSYPAINATDLGRFSVRLPPPAEQRAIADFLDAETARIDALIAKKRRLIETLDERSRAVVDAKLSSAADRHGTVALRRWLLRIEQGWSPRCEDSPARPDEWGVLKTSAVSTGRFVPEQNKRLPDDIVPDLRWAVRDGDLLVTRGSGSMAMVARAVVAQTQGRRLMLSDLVYRLVLRQSQARFVALVLNGAAVRRQIESSIRTDAGLTMKVRVDDLKGLRVPAVPTEIQMSLLAEIGQMTRPLDLAANRLGTQIELLQEHREALITAAVAGDLDVPGVAA